VEANTGLLDSLVVSPPMPPPGPSPPPPPPPFPGRNQFTCSAVNDPVVCSALGDLYYSTNGAGWTNPAGWSSAANGVPTDFCSFYQWGGGMAGPPCDTHGVLTFLCVTACQVVQRHLTPLPLQSNLYNNNLAGTIPSTLGNILSLTALCVRHSLRLSARYHRRISYLQYLPQQPAVWHHPSQSWQSYCAEAAAVSARDSSSVYGSF